MVFSEQAAPNRIRMILVLGALVALGPLTIDMYLPALPTIGEDLSVTSSVVQLTLTGTLAGLALGQLIIGPLSDSLGRRRPLIAGIVLHIVASLICMAAPNVAVLGFGRVLQGMGAAAGMVVALAVVGDLYRERAAATMMSRLMLVLGAAPVLAPSLGAGVLLHGSWRWVFAALVVLAGLLLLMGALALPETLPPSHRPPLRIGGVARTYVRLLRDARFVVLVSVAALAMAGLFAYIAGAAFVLQDRYGVDQQDFALLFGAGAVALIASTQTNPVLLTWFSPLRIVLTALSAAVVASAVFLGMALTHTGGVWGFLIPVWTILAAMGLVMPNAPALALSRHPESAGTAAALMGAAQFGLGALVAPLVGVLGNDEVAMAAVMAVSVVIALVALLSVRQGAADTASARSELAAGPA